MLPSWPSDYCYLLHGQSQRYRQDLRYPTSTTTEAFGVPLDSFCLEKGEDGWLPLKVDWIVTLQSTATVGSNARREPFDIRFDESLMGMPIKANSLKLVKGRGRALAIFFILKAAMELEPSDPSLDCVQKLALSVNKIPVNYTQQRTPSGHLFEAMYLSARGAERQRPSP